MLHSENSELKIIEYNPSCTIQFQCGKQCTMTMHTVVSSNVNRCNVSYNLKMVKGNARNFKIAFKNFKVAFPKMHNCKSVVHTG